MLSFDIYIIDVSCYSYMDDVSSIEAEGWLSDFWMVFLGLIVYFLNCSWY